MAPEEDVKVPFSRADAPTPGGRTRPLIGRDDDLRLIAEARGRGEQVLVLTGPPGVGKTRLAEAIAAPPLSVFVPCEHARSVADVIASIKKALAVGGGANTEIDLVAVLHDRGETVLILDHIDACTDASAHFERWCSDAPQLCIVATSRERLASTWTHELRPLQCPALEASPQEIAEAPAVQFLQVQLERSGASGPYPLEKLAAVAHAMDGIPLALQIASAELRTLGIDAFLRRMTSAPTVPAIEHALDASCKGLSAPVHETFARLSVFPGAFTEAHAAHVLGFDTSMHLAALRDKSLLSLTNHGELSMYASIRAYAVRCRERLPEALIQETQQNLVHTEAALAEELIRSRTQHDTRPGIFTEVLRARDNMREALRIAETLPPTEQTLRAHAALASALAWTQGQAPSETLAALDRALTRLCASDAGMETREVLEATVRLARQSVHTAVGHYEAALEDLHRVCALQTVSADVHAFARCYLGIQLRYQGKAREALTHHAYVEQCSPNLRIAIINEACLGRLYWDLGEVAQSRASNQAAYIHAERLKDDWTAALALANLAQLDQEHGELMSARDALTRALRRLERMGEATYEAFYAAVDADLLFETGDLEAARAAYMRACRFAGRLLAHRPMVILHGTFAVLLTKLGDDAGARDHFDVAATHAARAQSSLVDAILETHRVHMAWLRTRSSEAMAHHAAPEVQALARESGDLRFALRLLESTMQSAEAPKRGELVIAHDASWFTLADQARVDLRRRGALRRILLELANRAAEGPSAKPTPLPGAEVAAIGWPGERMKLEAQSTRVRVAIATLRRLGLRDVLITQEDGYVLEAASLVRR